MSVADKIQILNTIKTDIKTAINSKGGNVGDDFTTYAAAINDLETGGDGTFNITNDVSLAFSSFSIVPENIQLSDDCTKAKNLFRSCEKLTTLPDWNFLNINNGYSMCRGCLMLNDIPVVAGLTFRNMTDTQYMFYGCTDLVNVNIDITGSTNCQYMFYDCKSLGDYISLGLPNATNCQYMFYNTPQLQEVNLLSTNNVTTFAYCFYDYTKGSGQLYRVEQLDCSSVTTGGTANMFYYQTNLTDVAGFVNLGAGFEPLTKNYSFDLSQSKKLTDESLRNIIRDLADVTDKLNGYTCTLNLYNQLATSLSDEQIAIATSKGWTVA